jgi:hypothetical protein
MTRLTQSLLCTALLLLAARSTPADIVHLPIHQGVASSATYDAASDHWNSGYDSYDLDVNSDGIDDLDFSNSATAIMGEFPSGWDNFVWALHGASTVATRPDGTNWLATPLLLGDLIGPSLTYSTTSRSATFFSNDAYHSGELGDTAWTAPPDKYLGFQLNIDGLPHYGWVQVGESPDASGIGLRDAAYETQPNTPIHAGEVPEPACTALIAGVATLLLTHRRRRHPISQH